MTAEIRIDGKLHCEAKNVMEYKLVTLLTTCSPPFDVKESGATSGSAGGSIKIHDDRGSFNSSAAAQWWVQSVEDLRY